MPYKTHNFMNKLQQDLSYYNFKVLVFNNTRMEYNQNSKFENKISIESRNSMRSITKSLDRLSWQPREPSLSKKPSLVYAISIESQRKSDIFEQLLLSQKKPKNRTSNAIESTNFTNEIEYQQFEYQRNSDLPRQQNQLSIDHECGCIGYCLGTQCVCLTATNQMCVKGSCCLQCIQFKKQMFQGFISTTQNTYNQPVKQQIEIQILTIDIICNCKNTQCIKSYCKCFQNGGFCTQKCGCESCKNKSSNQQREKALNVIKNNAEHLFCTCKKTKCNKKYCTCYNAGVKCNKQCSCEKCQNCSHQKNQMDIEIYEGEGYEDYKNIQMPERMSFQKVTFQ